MFNPLGFYFVGQGRLMQAVYQSGVIPKAPGMTQNSLPQTTYCAGQTRVSIIKNKVSSSSKAKLGNVGWTICETR